MPSYGQLPVLHFEVLSAVIKDFKYPELIGVKLFPPETIEGIIAKWDILSPTRTKGVFRNPGSPAHRVSLNRISQKTATCIPMLLYKELSAEVLGWLRKPGTDREVDAKAKVREELESLDREIQRAKEWSIWQALTGTLTINQADVKVTVDYGIDATHKPTATVSWATTTTDIPTDIRTWKRLIQQDSGYTATRAFCNESVMNYMIANDKVKALLGESRLREQIGQSGYITRFMGLDWNVYDAGYKDASGTFYNYIANNYVVILPSEPIFGRMQVGSQMIPNPAGTDLVEARGTFSYSTIEANPPAKLIFAGENFLPVVPVPDAIVYADTVP